tara:strand:- start:4730 stop:5737 length:1008 start_codon:yes stop_codon:yes gene_type:complete
MSNIVLVTGSNGLVGNGMQLALKLDECFYNEFDANFKFHFVTRDDADLENEESCNTLFNAVKPVIVVHLAAYVGGLYANMRNPVNFFEKNILMQINVMRASKNCGTVKRIVSCLSTCIFPAKVSYPIKEEYLHEGEPHESNFAYAYAKRMIDVIGKAYEREHQIECINICPTNVYGPMDNFSLTEGHVIPALIHKCYNAIKNNVDFEVSGSGKPLRQFIYNLDLGRIIVRLIAKQDLKHKTYILSSPPDLEVSIKKIAELILDNFVKYDHAFKTFGEKRNIRLVWDTSKSDGQYKKTVSVGRLLDELGHIDFTPIDCGVNATVTWFNDNYASCRK